MVEFSKAPCAARYDTIYLNKCKMILFAFFLGPFKLIFMLLLPLVSCALWALLIKKILGKETIHEVTDKDGKKKKITTFEEEQSSLYWMILGAGTSVICKSLVVLSGLWITKKKLKVTDFFADYGPYEEKNKKFRAPILISNHITGIDYVIYLSQYDIISMLANSSTRDFPFIGKISETIQCVFCNRSSVEDKLRALEAVTTRIDNIMKFKRFPRLLFFPEGDTNNGEELMSFKYGAFENFSLIKIFCLKFDVNESIIPCHNLVSQLNSLFILSFSQFYYRITHYELDSFDPQYTLDRHGITRDHPDAVGLVIEDVRYLYECAFG